MADTKWSQFPSQTPGNSDEVVGLHSGDNARFTIANIVAAVRNGLANIFVPKTDVGAAGGVASLDNTGKVPTSQLPSSTGPEPATATPLMDGTGAVGASTKYAREDHEHPADTNKQAKITASGILKGDGQGGISAATAGTDYATPAQLDGKANPGQIGYPETGATASRNYSAGEYICWNGLLYTADTAIASGATFYTSGGNKNLTECVGGGFNDRSTGTVGLGTMTSGTLASYSLVRCGRVVVCTCQLYGLSGINRSDCVPFRMPAGFRPVSDTNIQMVFNDGSNGKQWITIGTLGSDGYVSAYNAVLGSFAPNVTAIQIQSAVWLI